MKSIKKTGVQYGKRRTTSALGFSLIELLVALGIFVTMSLGAMSLVKQHVPLAATVQNQVGLNIALSNVIAQIQSDGVNAGSGFEQQLANNDFPLGMTIINCGDVQNGCNNAAGNDTLNIIAMDLNTPAAPITDMAGNLTNPNNVSSQSCSFSTNTTIYITIPPQLLISSSPVTPAAWAAHYNTGDYILLVDENNSGNQLTTTQLTGPAQVVSTTPAVISLQIKPTTAAGVSQTTGPGSADPFFITSDKNSARLTSVFCGTNNALAMRISPTGMVTYSVDANNNLLRNGVVLAPNIVSFKIGAWAFNTGSSADQSSYLFNAPNTPPSSGCLPQPGNDCGYENDWPLIRSVLIAVVGRTQSNPTNPFRNSFDGGPYQVQAATTILNPRSLSMNDNQYTQ